MSSKNPLDSILDQDIYTETNYHDWRHNYTEFLAQKSSEKSMHILKYMFPLTLLLGYWVPYVDHIFAMIATTEKN